MKRQTWGLTLRKAVSALAVAALTLTGFVVLAGPALAEDPAGLQITKSASVTTVEPGDTFVYTIQISCVASSSVPDSGCTGANVTDPIPPQFSLNGNVTVVTDTNTYTIDTTGDVVSVDFTTPLTDPADTVGMLQGSTATITIPVVADNLTYDDNGEDVVNTATFSADNPNTPDGTNSATVVPSVPLVIGTDVSKEFDPASGPAAEGTPTTIKINAQNTSETNVDTMVITEPADPNANPNPFDALAFSSLVVDTFPANADLVKVDVHTPGGWTSGTAGPTPVVPSSVNPDDIDGIRITFSCSSGEACIVPDPDGTDVSIGVTQRDPGAIDSNITVPNTVQSTVSRDGESTSDTGDASYVIEGNVPTVTAEKSFSPDSIVHGETSDATLTGGVAGDLPVTELSIVEPSSTGDMNAPGFDDAMSFEGFASAPLWPDGATSASVTYYCVGGGTENVDFAEGEIPGDPSAGCTVARFSVDFVGLMPPGESATVVATVGTDPTDDSAVTTLNNQMTTSGSADGGTPGTATAQDDLYAFFTHIDSTSGKSITPSQILGEAGEYTVLQLAGGTAGRPDGDNTDDPYSTVDANTIVVQDPPAADPDNPDGPPAPSTFWDAFNPSKITNVTIPDGSELTVEYWDADSGTWETLAGPIDSSQSPWSYTITSDPAPEDVGGLRFTFTSDQGFPPGTTVAPNVVMNFDGSTPIDDVTTFDNCVSAGATASTGEESELSTSCDSIDVYPPDQAPGSGDVVDKYWLPQTELTQIEARSLESATTRLLWSTGGHSNVTSFVLTDVPDPTASVATSVFDAFNLTTIDAITPASDPLIAYDAIDAVQIYNGTAWVAPSASQCDGVVDGIAAAPCIGTMPEIVLTPAEQASTLAVRIVFIESPNRASSTDPLTPPAGSGVARSINNDRPVDLTFQIRDWRRSAPSEPVTGHTVFNAGDEGLVSNAVNGTAHFASAPDITADDADNILILDIPLGVTLTKEWDGSPVGIPPAGTPAADYPSTAVRLVAANNSGNAYVDQMTMTDDPVSVAGEATTFDFFNFTGFTNIGVPSGATSSVVTLLDSGGGTLLVGSAADALGWTGAQPPEFAAVTGFTIEFYGRIAPAATAPVDFGLQLRTTDRRDSSPVDATDVDTTVFNTSFAAVDDAGRDPVDQPDAPTARADDDVLLEAFNIGVEVDKSVGADVLNLGDSFTQVEPDSSQFVIMLSGQPTDGARPNSMIVADMDRTFWNAYEFVGIDPSFSLASPIDQVQMSVLSGADFVDTAGTLTVSGGVVDAGAAGAVPALPAGVTAAEVQGVSFEFSRVDGDQWENPWNPLQEIPIVVQRRAQMLSGGAPPTNQADNTPSPVPGGADAEEAAQAGHWTNTVTGSVTSYLSEGGAPISADAAPVDAEVIFERSLTSASVSKTPVGTVSPGQSIPYTLTFTNDGATPIFNPVFSDAIPVDGDGEPLLLPDPNAAQTGASLYSFGLTGALDPADGTALPTDEADITISQTDSPQGWPIEYIFSFEPAGDFVLGVGQTYTITIDMIPRPGLAATTEVVNTASVTGDRPMDQCNGVTVDNSVTPTYSCEADANVTIGAGGAIRSGKYVKVDQDDGLGAINVVGGNDCELQDSGVAVGFYAPPCVPVSAPGATETWRLVLQNIGNVPINTLIAIDQLPDVGDTTVINGFDRGSAWRATLVDPSVTQSGPTGATTNIFATTDDVPCNADLDPAGAGCPAGAWEPIATFSDLSVVTGIKYVTQLAEDNPLLPGDSVSIDVQTRTPASSPTAGPDTIAWNTVATGGTTTDGAELLATEGNKVGVALATGPIGILKTTSGDAAGQYAPASFDVEVVCTSVGEEVYRDSLTLTADSQVTINDLPWHSECVLEEGDNGQTESVPQTAIVERDTETLSVASLDNVYDYASLVVRKTVIGDGGESWSDPADAGPFLVYVTCEFLGEQVFADGYGEFPDPPPLRPMAALLRDKDVLQLDGLPAGAQCTVTELTTGNAAVTTVTTTTSDVGPVTQTATSTELTLTPDNPNTTNAVLFVNQFALGSLAIAKVVEGPGADEFGAGPFEFTVECVFEQAFPLPDVPTYSGDVTVEAGETVTIDGIVSGSTCTVVESDVAGADTYYLDGVDGQTEVTVTIAGTGVDTVTVEATNYFEDLVSLDVTKIVDDSAQDANGDVPNMGPFHIEVQCVYRPGTVYERTVYADGYDVAAPMANDLDNLEVWTLSGLPTGTTCTATETDTANADSTTTTATTSAGSSHSQGVTASLVLTEDGPLGATTNHFVFENAYDVGSLTISKVMEGPGADTLATGPFTFHVECSVLLPLPVRSTYSGDITLTGAPWSHTIDGIVAGSLCTVTETDAGGADFVTFTPAGVDASRATVLVGADANVDVVATNYFEDLASLAVTKTVADNVQLADGSSPRLGPFPVQVQCLYGEGTDHEQAVYADGYGTLRPMVVLLSPDQTVVFEGLPATSECTVTELANGGAVSTAVTVTTDDVGPVTVDGQSSSAVLTPDAPATSNEVEILNTYEDGSLRLVKEVTGEAAATLGAGPFEFRVSCVYARDTLPDVVTYADDVTLGGDEPLEVTIDGIVAGSDCTVTETDAAGADATTFQPGGGSAEDGATVAVAADATVTVTATNRFDGESDESGESGADGLSGTGYDGWRLAWIAGALVLLGAVALVIGRVRRRTR